MKEITKLLHVGREPAQHHGVVNPPVYHASTVIFPSLQDLEAQYTTPHPSMRYGRHGTPTTFSLEQVLADLENGAGTVLTPSGLNAICVALLSFVKTGDHILMIDSVYGPSRTYATGILKKLGIETTFFDPLIGSALKDFIQPNTKVLYLESPGSLTFEMPDIPVLTEVAHAHNLKTMTDNTWATPLYFKPFDFGIDISIHAGTKYMVGHSDTMAGVVTAKTEQDIKAIRQTTSELGLHLAPDDAYLTQRGLRTMGVRLPVHMQNALDLAEWLCQQPSVKRVLHPGLPHDPGYAIWKRDFTGATGLFSFVLKPGPRDALAQFVDHLDLFGMGFSWGGYESLILPSTPPRTLRPFDPEEGWLLRVHAGLDHRDDLIADLQAGLQRYEQNC